MCLLQVRVFRVMAVEAERRGGFGQMEIEFFFAPLSGFVGDVAGLAPHVERCVTAALRRSVQPDLVAAQTQIFFGVAGSGFQQLVLVVGNVGVMTFEAIANRGCMNDALDVGGVLIGMTGEA
jgi:hypothetical protein